MALRRFIPNRRAPCGCRWTMRRGQAVAWIDCNRHGGQKVLDVREFRAELGLGAVFG